MQLETFVVGRGRPLLFLAGATASFGYYKKFFELLGESYKIYFFNYPGVGRSAAPKKHNLEIYLNAVSKVVNDNSLKNFYLAGASFGGYLALEYAYHYPKGVEGVFLFSPMTCMFTTNKLGNAVRLAYTQFQKWNCGHTPLTQNVFTHRHFSKPWSKLRHADFVLKQNFDEKHIPRNIPILAVLGDKDKVVNSKYSEKIFKNFRNAKVVVIKNGSHDAFATIGDEILRVMNSLTSEKML